MRERVGRARGDKVGLVVARLPKRDTANLNISSVVQCCALLLSWTSSSALLLKALLVSCVSNAKIDCPSVIILCTI